MRTGCASARSAAGSRSSISRNMQRNLCKEIFACQVTPARRLESVWLRRARGRGREAPLSAADSRSRAVSAPALVQRSASRESRRASPPSRPPTTIPPAGGRRRTPRGRARPEGRLVDLDRPTDRGLGRRGKAVRRQLRRRLAGVDELADRAPDDRVRTAVVDVSGQREDVGDVGGGDEALACDLGEALRPQLDAVQHGRSQPGDRNRLVERSRDGAVEQVEVIGARRAGVQSGERARDVAGGLTRPACVSRRARRDSSSAASARSRGCGRPRARRGRTPGWRRSRSPGRAGSGASRRSRGSQGARGTRRPATRRPWRARRSRSQPSSSASRARSSDQREPALPPAPATLAPRAACDARARSASRSAG